MNPLFIRFLGPGVVALGALLLATFFLPAMVRPQVSLRKYAEVPPFSLTERSGNTVTNKDLSGKIWVADFIFTTCPGPCPLISANMANLQKDLAGDDHVQLVSFTVNPADDTPSILSAYADAHGADPKRWWFLTGPVEQEDDLILHGFYQPLEDNHGKQLAPGQFLITHSTRVVIVDSHGIIRGFFDGMTEEGRKSVLAAIHQLEHDEYWESL